MDSEIFVLNKNNISGVKYNKFFYIETNYDELIN